MIVVDLVPVKTSESGSDQDRVCLCFGTVVFMTLPVMSEKCLQRSMQFSDSATCVVLISCFV